MSDGACFEAKLLDVFICQLGSKHFDGSLGAQIDMFTQVTVGEAPPSQEMNQEIDAELLSHSI